MSDSRFTRESLLDFHRALLVQMPLVGSKLGYHPLAKSARQLREELNKPLPAYIPKSSAGEINGGLRALKFLGLAAEIRLTSGQLGWQATEDGKTFVAGWEIPSFEEPEPEPEPAPKPEPAPEPARRIELRDHQMFGTGN